MYTQHALVRCQQRGISREIVDVLLSFGTYRYRHGAEIYYMDRAARDQASKVLGHSRYAKLADRLNTYIVVSPEGDLITAAPRRRRLKC
jgi:hypothetical protein